MRIKNAFRFIGFLIILVPFVNAACHAKSEPSSHGLAPQYLLTGTEEATVGNFVYYSINNNTEYAVALKNSAKSFYRF